MSAELKESWLQVGWVGKASLGFAVVAALSEYFGIFHALGIAALNLAIMGFLWDMGSTLTRIHESLDDVKDEVK